MILSPTSATTDRVCPACFATLEDRSCVGCGRVFPEVAGIPDLRLGSDRFLDLDAERSKASRLARLSVGLDLEGLAEAYYDMTPDVDPERRACYLGHILSAEARGSALASALPRSGKILEVGCGTGGLLAAAAKLGLDIEGTDIALRWLVVARHRLAQSGRDVPLVAASCDRLPYADASFDTIVADSVLEHLDDPSAAFREWARVLRPGGSLVVWSPNRYTLTVDPHVRLWGLGWLPRRIMRSYVRIRRGGAWPPVCLSSREAFTMAKEAGFASIDLSPPVITEDWASGLSSRQRKSIAVYSRARVVSITRSLLLRFGPLWQLRATLRGAR